MDRTVLNADVLLLVFSLARKQTKLALISTCQVLYREGGKQLLKSTEVRIEREPKLESFLLFMDADGGSRMRSLHRLRLDIKLNTQSRSVAERLKKMISRLAPVSQLTSLSILSLESLLATHPPLSKAIAKLTSIKKIYFYSVGRRSLKMLNSMQSKLESVDIVFGRSKSGVDVDTIMFLAQFSSSLRYLTVDGGGATEDPQDDDPQYPLLSELALHEPSASPITWHYVRAFPNLKIFGIMMMEGGVYEGGVVGPAEFRAENVAHLRRHGCWESLNEFSGPLVMLWLLGLPCPVLELILYDDYASWEVTPDMLRDTLAPTQATKLNIDLLQIWLFLDEEFTRAFAEGCGATLTTLRLRLVITPDLYMVVEDDSDLDLDDLDLDDIFVSVRVGMPRHQWIGADPHLDF